MRKQVVTIVLGAVVMLGTATTLFAQGLPTGGYPPVMGGAGGNPAVPGTAYFPEGRPFVGSGTSYHQPTKHYRKIYMSAKHQKNGK
jgi:hypothetical protein